MRLREALLSLAPSRRVGYLIEQPRTRQLLRRLPPQDLLIAIHAAGVNDSLELIELLPSAQVQSFIDLEGWNRDRVSPRTISSWLSVLYAANAAGALRQIMGLDAELVTLFLKIHTRVYDLTQEEDPEGVPDGALRTPDQRYLVAFVPPPHPDGRETPDPTDLLGTEVAKQIVSGLIAREPFTASRYLEAVRWELPSELEEACLRWRQGRLTDLGFYDLYEALAIFSPVDLSRRPRPRTSDVTPEQAAADISLALFVDEYAGASLLRDGCRRLSAAAADRVRGQLVALANRVVAAHARPPAEPEAIAAAVRETAATLNLGLEYYTRGAPEQAEELLSGCALVDIFRAGHTLAWQLGQKARSVRNRLIVSEGRTLLSPPVEDLFTALGRRAPRLHAGLVDPGCVEEVPFETLAQLARAAEVVAEVAFASALLLDVVGMSVEQLPAVIGERANLGDVAEATLDKLLATALARVAVGGKLEPSPLEPDELAAVHRLVQDEAAELGNQLAVAAEEAAASALPLPGAPDPEALRTRCLELGNRIGEAVRLELAAVKGEPDGRFISALVCQTRAS